MDKIVTVRIPNWTIAYNELLLLDDKNEPIGIATPSIKYDFNDGRGAKHSAQRKSDRNKAISKLNKSAPDIDVGARIIEFGKSHLPVVPNEPKGIVSVNSHWPVARVETPRVITDKKDDSLAQRRAEAQQRLFDGLEKMNSRKVAK